MTARAKIVKRLFEAQAPLPIHALNLDSVSQTSASARMRELAKDGIVEKVKVAGCRYDYWRMVPADLTLPLVVA